VPADAATPARWRAPRGANREAVLRIVGERPGVTASELAASSQVTGGTLYTLLRRLLDEGTLEKRELPGGRAGYALATSAAAAAAEPQTATTEAKAAVESRAGAEREQHRADSTQTADAARSVPTVAQASEEPAS
jgi:DNA-binding MarR family transcriptional regulator